MDIYVNKTNRLKADIYSVNSENYLYLPDKNIPINTIPASGRTAKILTLLKDKSLLTFNYQNQLYNARILTEKECFHLMGLKFPTLPFSSQILYRVAGNSICVPVLEALIKNLLIKQKEGEEY